LVESKASVHIIVSSTSCQSCIEITWQGVSKQDLARGLGGMGLNKLFAHVLMRMSHNSRRCWRYVSSLISLISPNQDTFALIRVRHKPKVRLRVLHIL